MSTLYPAVFRKWDKNFIVQGFLAELWGYCYCLPKTFCRLSPVPDITFAQASNSSQVSWDINLHRQANNLEVIVWPHLLHTLLQVQPRLVDDPWL